MAALTQPLRDLLGQHVAPAPVGCLLRPDCWCTFSLSPLSLLVVICSYPRPLLRSFRPTRARSAFRKCSSSLVTEDACQQPSSERGGFQRAGIVSETTGLGAAAGSLTKLLTIERERERERAADPSTWVQCPSHSSACSANFFQASRLLSQNKGPSRCEASWMMMKLFLLLRYALQLETILLHRRHIPAIESF